MELDHSNPLPLHAQLRNKLATKINNGDYADRLPSEREFMDQFQVSRSTVRQAISQLVKEGLLVKRHGIGTFVSPKPIQEWLGNLKSTTETIREMGMSSTLELIAHGPAAPTEQLRDLVRDEEVYFIKRLRCADDKPFAIENDYYPLSIGKRLAEFDLNAETIYDLLENKLLLNLNKAKQIITAGEADEENAKLLQMETGDSVLISDRFITSSDEEWVEFSKTYFRPDMYSFSIDLKRKNG